MVGADKLDLLSRLQPLASLGVAGLRGLLPICRVHSFARNANPLASSDWYGQVIYLLQGELKLEMPDGSERVIVGGYEQGSFPLARCVRRPLRCKAITDIKLLAIDEDALDILLTWNQLAAPGEVARMVSNDAQDDNVVHTDWHLMSGMFSVVNLTQGAFANLPAANIQALLARFQRMKVRRGDAVIRQGDPGDYYYLIESGRCMVSRRVADSSVQLAELKEGDAFGEDALVADTVRNATVVMKTDGVLLRLARTDFNELLCAPLLRRVSADEAQRQVAAGAIWIDVRFPAEFQSDGYPDAINIPLNEIRQAARGLDPTREYVIYCQTGRRSSAAAFLLSKHGFHAALLDGGMRSRAEPMESVK